MGCLICTLLMSQISAECKFVFVLIVSLPCCCSQNSSLFPSYCLHWSMLFQNSKVLYLNCLLLMLSVETGIKSPSPPVIIKLKRRRRRSKICVCFTCVMIIVLGLVYLFCFVFFLFFFQWMLGIAHYKA